MADLRIRPVTLSKVEAAPKGVMTNLIYLGDKIRRPYTFWIIEGAGKNVIVDTSSTAEQYRGYHPGFKNIEIDHLCSFEEGLARASLKPEDIDLVIQTHLHFDHCYNTYKCKNAKVLVQEAELNFARYPHPIFASMYDIRLLNGLDFEVVRGRRQVLPGIEVVPVPGHTPGCQAVAVDTKKGRAVISGFCCILENFFPAEDIRERVSPFAGYPVIIPGINYSAVEAYESLLKVKGMADIIIPNHEPSLMDVDVIP